MGFTSILGTKTLLNGLIAKSPDNLSIEELDQLQQFVNKGRSLVLLKDHPKLESIFGMYAIGNRESVVDVLVCFLDEGGLIGTSNFRKMVEGLISRGVLSPAVLPVLEESSFMLPLPPANVNSDGVAI